MPSKRRFRMKEKAHSQEQNIVQHSAETEVKEEPTDLRIKRKQRMDESPETNGCEDGPTVAVRNHTDSSQGSKMSERNSIKSSSLQEGRTTRHVSGNMQSSRNRRYSPGSASHSVTSSPSKERRATRQSPSSPVQATPPMTLAEKRLVKNSLPVLTPHNQLNKRSSLVQPSSHPTHTVSSPVSVSITLSSQENSANVKHSKRRSPIQSSSSSSSPPSVQKRQLKRVSSPELSAAAAARASKRMRLQYQPFQSPPPLTVIPAILRNQPVKTPEDKIVVFQKGEFLAVRNENGNFFVCRTAQNVYKSSKRFKIQWMNNDNESDIYTPDFYDNTDFECVLTNLRLKRVDKNKYLLPDDEHKRTLNILQRALNVENGMDIPDPLQVSTDGVDVSIVGKQEEEEVTKLHNSSPRAEVRRKSLQLKNRGRPKKDETGVIGSPRSLRSIDGGLSKPNTVSAKVKLQSKDTVKVKLKAKQGKINLPKRTVPASNQASKNIKPIERLHPNPKVTTFEKDPTFETSLPVPYVSSSAHSKLLIRAVYLKDFKLLKSLLEDTQKICSLDVPRSIDVHFTALTYAVFEEDHRAIRTLLSIPKRKYASPPENLLTSQDSGSVNFAMFGHALRQVNLSRGGREGNNAFLKDNLAFEMHYPTVSGTLIKDALRIGVSVDTLNLLCIQNLEEDDSSYAAWNKSDIFGYIIAAVRSGHNKLAGRLVQEAYENGGYGFGLLHKEVLLFDRQLLTKFRSVSVVKRAYDNAGITPLHCAAINPNPQYLTALLSVNPRYDITDKDGWKPIHYAAVCKTTGPLELLLSRGLSVEEVDSEGNTPYHVACIAGRAHNIDILLNHTNLADHTKKENSPSISPYEFGNNAVDRANKKSYTLLHLASQYGHMDAVRVLLRHKATLDKQTNAAHDKLTPLMLAAQQGHLSIVKLLVENAASVELKDKKQRTSLTHAVINGQAHVASYLLRLGANPNTSDSSGNTLVHYTAAYGWYFCLKLLIEAGASLNLPNDWKVTPLSLAFMKGHMGLVDYLVEQPGIDINVEVHNENGMTLVMQALRSSVSQAMLDRVHFLVVKQKADCTKVDFEGNNALHYLVLSEVEEIKKKKLSCELTEEEDLKTKIKEEKIEESSLPANADNINSPESDENNEEASTVEEKAERKEDTSKELFKEELQEEHDALLQEVTKLLLDNGCNPETKNVNGDSPLTLAVKEGCLLLVKLFLDAGCQLTADTSQSGDNILHYLVEHAYHGKVEEMLQTILSAKCKNAESNPRQMLCQMTKVYNNNGYTPLLQALNALQKCENEESRNRLETFVKFLVEELGADIADSLKDSKGNVKSSALHLAAECHGRNALEILLSRKPSLDVLDSNMRTPLVVAINSSNTDAAESLIKAGANVNTKSVKDKNRPLLLLAARNPKLNKIVQLLVHYKAEVNETDPVNSNTALHFVVSNRESDVLETVKILALAGANINAVNDKQRTPVHLAVNSSESGSDASYSVEEYLLSCGAKTDVCDLSGRIPLHYAFVKISNHQDITPVDPVELVTLLVNAMKPSSLDIADNYGQTPLHRAAYRGATISTMNLLQKMKNIDPRDKSGNTPLSLAVKNGHESCTLMLLQKGANFTSEVVHVPEVMKKNNLFWNQDRPKAPLIKKHSILQEILLKEWQGIFFYMLDSIEGTGKGMALAVESAIKTAKYNVALKLISRMKHGWTLYSEKQSMLHLLAREAPSSSLSQLQMKVSQALIEKGVPMMSKDEHGCSVLTYASINWNHELCSFFSGKMGMVAVAQSDPDKSLRTPFSALFWKLGSEDLPKDMKEWCLCLLKAGANLNMLTRYPIKESGFPGVRCSVDDVLHVEDSAAPKWSPLMVAIYKQNYSVIKLLLENGADINLADDLQRTPLMLAARLNDIKMVKLLLNYSYDQSKDKNPENEQTAFQKTSAAEMSKKDINGWSVVHHLISPLQDYGYNNTSLLYFLAEMGAPLDMANNAGDTPIQMAVKCKRESMIKALQELLSIPEDKKEKTVLAVPAEVTDGVQYDMEPWNYKEDAKAQLLKKEEEERELMDTSEDAHKKYEPDSYSGFQNTGEVVMDTDQNIPYDVLMTVVDLKYGSYGIYNFYKMQIIKQKGRDLFILFTRWGRVGDSGQYQRTPYSTLQDAVKEYCKIFRSKSGNNWEDLQNFQPHSKKYRLVQLEKRFQLRKEGSKIKLSTDKISKLPKCLEDLMNNLMDVQMLEESMKELGVNRKDRGPFGWLEEGALLQAEDILKEIGTTIAEKDALQKNLKSQDQYAELMQKIVKLSEDFYQVVPLYGYEYESLPPLFSPYDLHDKMDLVHNLLNIELAGEMMLGAQKRLTECHPADYVYRCLNCNLQLLDESSQESQMILQYISNTAVNSKPAVEAIYRVYRKGEFQRLQECGVQNHFLLWHGTRAANLLGILTRGLQVAPLGVHMSGSSMGKGIYFADMFSKSEDFCIAHYSDHNTRFILLCQVALGNIKDENSETNERSDSVKASGCWQPDPVYCASWEGLTVPLGKAVEEDLKDDLYTPRYLNYNEYVVYKPSQVCIRYLIQFRA